MSTATYFANRLSRQAEYIANATHQQMLDQLNHLYTETMNQIIDLLTTKWEQLHSRWRPSTVNDLLLYNKYVDQIRAIQEIINNCARAEYQIDNTELIDLYNGIAGYNLTGYTPNTIQFGQFDSTRAQQVVNSLWCSDGRHFSSRIWSNRAELNNRLQQGLINCLTVGAGKDDLTKMIQNAFDVSLYKADRIARTELTYVQNQCVRDRYIASGITRYKYLAAHDSRVSDICKRLDGRIFNLADARVGVNYPPMHCNCRSTVLAVID